MRDFRIIRGFEDVWRPPVRTGIKRPEAGHPAIRARLARVVGRTPEVMVKVTGRTRDPAHVAAHLSYITRNGELEAEDQDGLRLAGREDVLDLAEDWSAMQMADSRRRSSSRFSVGLILSMPAGTDPLRLRDAARQFARESFAETFDYVFVLHTDTANPHVHLSVRALGRDGSRLNPRKADLEVWRQRFAESLREHGVDAEATPRRSRGVTLKADRTAIRKMRERWQFGRGGMPRVHRAALAEAASTLLRDDDALRPWEARLLARQRRVRELYLLQARVLQASADPGDRRLGAAVEAFLAAMRPPDTRRLRMARELRAAGRRKSREARSKDRS